MSFVCVFADECTSANCLADDGVGLHNRWTMPLLKLGEKRFYLGIFFKVGISEFNSSVPKLCSSEPFVS